MSAKSTLTMLSSCVIPVFLLILAPAAQAAAPDVGLVTGLAGEVTYWHPEEKQPPAKAQAFLKIRQGDHFNLPVEAQLQLTYFAGGRQETWKGPVTLEVGDQESRAAGKEPPPSPFAVKVLPAKVAKRMKGAPTVEARPEVQASGVGAVGQQSVRSSGVIQTMAPKKSPAPPPAPGPLSHQDKKEVAEAEKIYQDLKKQAKPGDLTPIIYLLTIYADYGQYHKMERVIDTMLAERPDDPNLKKLKAWARSLASGKP